MSKSLGRQQMEKNNVRVKQSTNLHIFQLDNGQVENNLTQASTLWLNGFVSN